MAENKSSISDAKSYKEIGEFWDSHDLGDFSDETEEVEFEVELHSDVFYYAVENSLSSKLRSIAKKHGVSPETLVNLWLEERANQETTKS